MGLAVGLAMLGVIWFYFWTVASSAANTELRGQKSDYYNLLVDGFEDGHLYMKADPDPRLLALPPEQRPGDAPFKLDASLYAGRYYLYFGVAPVVTLCLPYALLTGHDLPEALAGVIFMALGFGLAVAWWLGVRRQFFPRLAGVWTLLGVLALGLGSAAPSALRRPMFYEVAIGAGYAFSMLGLWAVTQAWRRPAQRFWWLAIAGVAVGLAVGSRANLAPAGLLLLGAGAVGLAWREPGKTARTRILLLALLSAGGGAGGVGAGLAVYNYARFGNVTEFGHHHQIGTNPKQMFRGENLRHNLSLYYLKAPVLNGYFPFVAPADEAAKPSDYVGREHVHGEWVWTLLVAIAALGGILAVDQRGKFFEGNWWRVLALPGLLFVVNGVVVGLTGVRSNRYMLDFHPALILATLLWLAAGITLTGWRGRLIGVLTAVALPVALIFNVLASFQVHGFFQTMSPITFARLSAQVDGAVWPALKSEASAVGDREVIFRWPSGLQAGQREPLLRAGTKDFSDEILLDYDGAKRARFIFNHGEYGDVTGDWFSYVSGARATLRISGGPLLPGESHPWYGSRDEEERMALKRRLRITVDGRVGFDRDVVSYNSSPRLQQWGERREADGTLEKFSGVIERVTSAPLDDSWHRARKTATGPFRLKLHLPDNRYGTIEPLLQSGKLGGFDTLALSYLRPGFVRLFHDQLGGGGRWSEEFAVDYKLPHYVEISLPAASDAGVWAPVDGDAASDQPEFLRVRWNGREVFRPSLRPVPARPLSVGLGVNGWNSSNVSLLFSGTLEESPRLESVGGVRADSLEGRWSEVEATSELRGVWLRFDRNDGKKAALVWQREPDSGRLKFGWIENDQVSWLAGLAPADLTGLIARLHFHEGQSVEPREPTWIELELKDGAVFAQKAKLVRADIKDTWASQPSAWHWNTSSHRDLLRTGPPEKLPGRIKLRFKLPSGGFNGADPLLSVGQTGAADSIFLRSLGGDLYALGLDHWGVGAVESGPITLAPDRAHTLTIELGSLAADGNLTRDRARLIVDGQLALDVAQPLYPVKPGEIVFGKNPLGMSTSGPLFRGDLIFAWEAAAAEELR